MLLSCPVLLAHQTLRGVSTIFYERRHFSSIHLSEREKELSRQVPIQCFSAQEKTLTTMIKGHTKILTCDTLGPYPLLNITTLTPTNYYYSTTECSRIASASSFSQQISSTYPKGQVVTLGDLHCEFRSTPLNE